MRSHSFTQLLAKEWRELFASRSYWLLLLMIGPLVGHGFITAVGLYAEASGGGGGPAALAQGLTPLDGILAQIRQPLKVTVVLSPEDPRLTDFEQNVLRKLRRVLPRLDVDYSSNSRTGLFEKPEDHYGEIWYEMNGQRVMERSTIEEVVLEQIYKLAGIKPPARSEENTVSGYPLSVTARGAALIFYGLWPLLTTILWWIKNRLR